MMTLFDIQTAYNDHDIINSLAPGRFEWYFI